MLAEKCCACCKHVKPCISFYKDSHSKDGLQCYCKDCNNDRQRLPKYLTPKFGENHRGTMVERLWSKINKVADQTSCWEWIATVNNHGYGQLNVDHKRRMAHILVYAIAYGPIPDGMEVCHSCDNPPCCRPSHLFLGTHEDNMRDCAIKQRTCSNNTEETIRAIRACEGIKTLYETAIVFHKHPRTIQHIWRRESWKHLV